MMAGHTILLATGNPAKGAKLRWLLDGLGLEPATLAEHPDLRLPDETSGTFRANAELKAIAASRACDGLAIASDGGVVIPALGDAWDALRTGRAAGPGATDEAKARHLLALMAAKRGDDRRVSWSEAVAVADRGMLTGAWGAAETSGVLTETYDPAQAIPGFWVYSLWYFPQAGKRYVELTAAELEGQDRTWMALREQVRRFFQEGRARQS